MTNSICLIIDPVVDPSPTLVEPEDADAWPSPASTEQLHLIVAEIIKRGFQGVRANWMRSADGRTVATFSADCHAPEGRMFLALLSLARLGCPLVPTEEAIEILERVYRARGLPLLDRKGCRE